CPARLLTEQADSANRGTRARDRKLCGCSGSIRLVQARTGLRERGKRKSDQDREAHVAEPMAIDHRMNSNCYTPGTRPAHLLFRRTQQQESSIRCGRLMAPLAGLSVGR